MLHFEEIIAGCAQQKEKSKESLYKAYYGYLIAVILRYVKERDDAEELVNDVFIKIFGAIHQFVLPSDKEHQVRAFKAWISKIASRSSIDFLRSKKDFVSLDDVHAENEPASKVNVVESLNAKDILKLLDNLPEMHRVIFNLYEIEGYSHDEISKALNIPESSSRVYLTRAKNKLRTLYLKLTENTYATYGT
ncbi:MAG: sigma-70 family RNA polymerase sigma factor [Pedobacter sp.]|nr:MAG: sigma-70 family RNA polymerase sigma factor [Pedobacter sp.]